jgi:hypothetical protein
MTVFVPNHGAYYSQGEVVTPHDTDAQGSLATKNCDAIYVGGTGHLTVIMEVGGSLLISAIPAGTTLPIRVSRVMAATTATLVVALWR